VAFNRGYNPPLFTPIVTDGAPTKPPVIVGATYVDTQSMNVYISVGTSTALDWKQVNTGNVTVIANNPNLSGFKTILHTITQAELQAGVFDVEGSIDQIFFIARERVLYSEGKDWTMTKTLIGARITLLDSMLPGSDEALEPGDQLYLSAISSAKFDVSPYPVSLENLLRGYLTIPFTVSKVLYVARDRVLYYEGQDYTVESLENETHIVPAGALALGGVEALTLDETVIIGVLI
jgi:hypothetical protein